MGNFFTVEFLFHIFISMILHLCMGEDIHKLKTNLILLTGPGFFFVNFDWTVTDGTGRELLQNRDKQPASEKENQGSTKM
jgi:hypothetical protein